MAHRSVGARSRLLLPTSNCAIRRARNRPHPILSVSDYVFLEHWFPPATEYTKAIRVFVTRKRLMGHRLRDGAIDCFFIDRDRERNRSVTTSTVFWTHTTRKEFPMITRIWHGATPASKS